MAFPPPVLPVNFTNATPQVDAHPANHNALSQAVNDITAWVKPAGRLVGVLQPYTATPFSTVADIPSSSINVPLMAGHRYLLQAQLFGITSVVASANLIIADNANTQMSGAAQVGQAGAYVNLAIAAYVLPGVAQTYKLRLSASAGTFTMSAAATFWIVDYGTP